jgi:hypothetical protein
LFAVLVARAVDDDAVGNYDTLDISREILPIAVAAIREAAADGRR